MDLPIYYTHSAQSNSPCEDGHVAFSSGNKHLFAVIDGHGGPGVKDLIVSRLSAAWTESAFRGTMALEDVVEKLERAALSDPALAGCGACLAMVQYDPEADHPLTVASVGDCAVIAAYEDEEDIVHPFRASGVKHRYSESAILVDAIQSGCDVRNFTVRTDEDRAEITRVSVDRRARIQHSRTIGDAGFKKRKAAAAISAIPNVFSDYVCDIPFVVLCSDGVTQNLSDGEIVAIVSGYAYDDASGCARGIIDAAEKRAAFRRLITISEMRSKALGSERLAAVDDMTAIVVFLRRVV